jgi:hypothetical protein
VLVVAEVALSLLLLIAAGLFVRSLQSARAIDPGFEAGKLVSAPLNVNLLRYTRLQGREFYRQVVERVEHVPGVESASLARIAVLGGSGRVQSIHVEGRGATHEQAMSEGGRVVTGDRTIINANVVGPRFFRRSARRGLSRRDDAVCGRPSRQWCRQRRRRTFFRREPDGKRISVEGPGPWREIVGGSTANTVRSPKAPRPLCSCLSRRITRRG